MNNLPFVKNGPKISVIVPAYNVEKTLAGCLDSILSQSYENLEIIIVDDGSTDRTLQIMEQYASADSRILTVAHEKNKGLFQARLTGSEHATGKYIAFVDSDDKLSFDWYRILLKKAIRECADIVVGEWCFDYADGRKEYSVLDPFRVQEWDLKGEAVLHEFMRQEGRSFSWSVVWNKLYTKELWDRCYPYLARFSKEHDHMLMWEDVAFSCALWSEAKHVVNVRHVFYYYYKGENNSTTVQRNSKRLEKYVSDSTAAMQFMKYILTEKGRFKELEAHYQNWKQDWGAMVYRDVVITGQQRGDLKRKVIAGFDLTEDRYKEKRNISYTMAPVADSFSWYEGIKKSICEDKHKYISFDVFDTLVERPFMQPTDLFNLLSDRLNKHTSAYIDFVQIRCDAEADCRHKCWEKNHNNEEISLLQIYQEIEDTYCFEHTLLMSIMRYEMELEERFCTSRAIGKEFYELALDAGKKILICSDMYLPQETVKQILAKNGYTEYQRLYLSSELNLTKWTVHLFEYMLKDMRITVPGTVMHIGDNWQSDFENPRKCGMDSGHINKASDLFRSTEDASYKGNLYQRVFHINPDREDYRQCFNDFPAIRSVFALCANKTYGNPFVSFSPSSAFNGDPNLIGYNALGPHLLAVAQWLIRNAEMQNVGTIHFVARDGFLVKQAFDLLNQTKIKSSYIRVSRKAMLLADVDSAADLYSLYRKVDVVKMTPMKLAGYLNPIIPEVSKEKLAERLEAAGFYAKRELASVQEYQKCMKFFIDNVVEMQLLSEYKRKLHEYFGKLIKPGDWLFDIGYSGRTESALSNLLGFPVGSFYIHVNSDIAQKRQLRYSCPCMCFYDYKPSITGVMREHLFMELAPSTIGYRETEEGMEPIFEEYKAEYDSERMTVLIQRAAIAFINDFVSNFGDLIPDMYLQSAVISAPYEHYLHYADPFDRALFATLPFEDDVNARESFSALDFWNNEIYTHHLTTSRGSGYSVGNESNWFEGIYPDGLYVKFYRWLNRKFPRGSSAREKIKDIVRLFVH